MSVITTSSESPASVSFPAPERIGVHGNDGIVRWEFRRNCSLSPRLLMAFYGGMCAVSLTIATFFWMQGARLVMPFAWLELLALGAALLYYARHVADRQRIEINGARVSVEHTCGGRVERVELMAAWVKVEPQGRGSGLVLLSSQGQTVSIGRFLRPEAARQLARELRMQLRATPVQQPVPVAAYGGVDEI